MTANPADVQIPGNVIWAAGDDILPPLNKPLEQDDAFICRESVVGSWECFNRTTWRMPGLLGRGYDLVFRILRADRHEGNACADARAVA